jgi:putative membrane protein
MSGGTEDRMSEGARKDETHSEERAAAPVRGQSGRVESDRKLTPWRRLISAIGFGPGPRPEPVPEGGDVGTRLAQQRTELALDRNYLAAERTLMAWIRTALSMISFGFSMAKLFQAFRGEKGLWKGALGHEYSVESIGYYLVVMGTGGLMIAVVQHYFRIRRLRAMGLPRGVSVAFVVGVLLCFLGVFAFSSLVLKL